MRAFEKDERDLIDRILQAIELGQLLLLMDDVQDLLQIIAQAGGAAALDQIGIVGDESIVNLVNEYAVQYARDRAAEMVGKRWIGSQLVDNPSAAWRIDEATRDLLRGLVTQAMQDGWSNDRLAGEITDAYAFSDERAEVIARTETAFADVQGNLHAYRVSGQVASKQWLTAPDNCCDECEALNGTTVGIDEQFPGEGDDGPPLHPNCRCDVLPILIDLNADEG